LMKLYTGYFARHGNHPRAVSIARSQPMAFDIPEILELAPARTLLADYKSGRIGWDDYAIRYRVRLGLLVAGHVEELLQDGMVLICWESPHEHCHRHLLADWLRECGHEVEELP